LQLFQKFRLIQTLDVPAFIKQVIRAKFTWRATASVNSDTNTF